jgi:hypothetical protein
VELAAFEVAMTTISDVTAAVTLPRRELRLSARRHFTPLA